MCPTLVNKNFLFIAMLDPTYSCFSDLVTEAGKRRLPLFQVTVKLPTDTNAQRILSVRSSGKKIGYFAITSNLRLLLSKTQFCMLLPSCLPSPFMA